MEKLTKKVSKIPSNIINKKDNITPSPQKSEKTVWVYYKQVIVGNVHKSHSFFDRCEKVTQEERIWSKCKIIIEIISIIKNFPQYKLQEQIVWQAHSNVYLKKI